MLQPAHFFWLYLKIQLSLICYAVFKIKSAQVSYASAYNHFFNGFTDPVSAYCHHVEFYRGLSDRGCRRMASYPYGLWLYPRNQSDIKNFMAVWRSPTGSYSAFRAKQTIAGDQALCAALLGTAAAMDFANIFKILNFLCSKLYFELLFYIYHKGNMIQ